MRYHVLIATLALGVLGSPTSNEDADCMRPPTAAEKAAHPDRIWFTGMEHQPAGNATGRYGLTNDHGATAAYWRFQPGLVDSLVVVRLVAVHCSGSL
ncbi:hypothetical protein NQ176_g7546 [Zarea fungicola]|uniref:Uncharacterized protein n=1 Tax=Zarea fungicola TaxID=93591 RepID=A0ACC1MYY1_9HYPO|nr:hypothetical protein NQ176_g7546 [Lecanicillium fungicola]